ncbi:DUF488 domain-containing protein [Cryobacterium sp. RTS3]|uniref:DUF488 domain-containing protein n=1 Tax=Cryobacterium sp. RTS3 TaxID=3048643 RepID=UPI002B2316E2|nr:DUF488 domain-containing protein [Cryobacterium sp. RTS3]MEB0000847.1 DUF488 domain-containing protein [Cryobacterium sp. RTS3]
MWTQTAGALGAGYEGKDIDGFIDGLASWGIDTLVDVRLNPISRKRGFSKNKLREALISRGISYRHEPALGNPKDNREGYSTVGTDLGNAARARFAELLSTNEAELAMDQVAELASRVHVAVMCFEASELNCHRREVLKELDRRLAALMPA